MRACSLVLAAVLGQPLVIADERPNILWITAEDMSPILGCYGDRSASTPHFDALATQSIRYTNAFATAPVCSPVRSCLITGCYAPSLGTHNMRSAMRLPHHVHGFPHWLRQAGYFTSNNVKTDYNTADAQRLITESWNESSGTAHWRNRPQRAQPFFSVFNLMTTHQSRTMVWPYEKFRKEIQAQLSAGQIHDSDLIGIPPYYPDTPIVRRDWARLYDCATLMDQQVGEILEQLRDDGLAESTIVFFFSDHGSGMPRHKRALLDSGMHVPLLVRIPQKFRHLATVLPGTTSNRLVSFVDFPPTVLNLAGIDTPKYMQGNRFLGSQVPDERAYAFGHRDRVDEAFDCSRSVRSKQFLYIRNFMPHLSYNQPTAWPDQGELRHEFYRSANRSTMSDAQWQFAGPTRPVEELYDCSNDPMNLKNLVEDPAAKNTLMQFRKVLKRHLYETVDMGMVPEVRLAELRSTAHQNINAELVRQQLKALDVGRKSENHYLNNIQHSNHLNPEDCFWDAVALRQQESLSDEAVSVLQKHLPSRDGSQFTAEQIEIAHALVHHRTDKSALAELIRATESSNLNTVLHATRTIELLGAKASSAGKAIRAVADRCQSILPAATTATFVQTPEQDLAMFISFSANAFLAKHARLEN